MLSRIGFALQAIATLCAVLALTLVAIWIVPPWWTPFSYLGLWLIVLLLRMPHVWHSNRNWPRHPLEYTGLAILIPIGLWASIVTSQALAGRTPQNTAVIVNVPFPLRAGTYLVASGGATATVNGHFLTLHPITERQRDYRGQSYGVDLVKVDRWGLRASAWRPVDPMAYGIFGEPVFAPCHGIVLAARDGMPDMPVPNTDKTLLEGNHVFINCGDFAILLAHLKRDSVLVRGGDHVAQAQKIGEVGNSGQSTEPHLHIHAQRLAPSGAPLLSGEPLHLAFDGDFPFRNKLISRD